MPLASGHPDGHYLTMIKAQTLSSITLKGTTVLSSGSPLPSTDSSCLFLNKAARQAKNTFEVCKCNQKEHHKPDLKARAGKKTYSIFLKYQKSGIVWGRWKRRRGSRSESHTQWGLSLLGAMLLANPLTTALTWRMLQLLHTPDTVGRRAVEYQPAAGFLGS